MAGVEEIAGRVVVSRSGDDHEVCVLVALLRVQRGLQVQGFVGQVILNVVVLDGRLPAVHHFHALRHHIHGRHLMALRQQGGNAHSYVASACNGDFHHTVYNKSSVPTGSYGRSFASKITEPGSRQRQV